MVFLKAGEKREVAIGLAAGIISGVASIIIASNYIATKASEKTIARTMSLQQRPRIEENVYGMNIGTSGDKSKQKLSVSITTNEFYNNIWNPVLAHTFYGETEEELENLIQSHRKTDIFFDASFKGTFNWKGTKIELKNSEPKLLYV